MQKVKLFCIPYSGASSMIYNKWKESLNDKIVVVPVEFPGRGQNFGDPLCTTADELIEYLYEQIEPQLDENAFAFYGHCIGGALAYDLAMKIEYEKNRIPVHMFFSGRQVPHLQYRKKVSKMSEKEFLDELFSMEEPIKCIMENNDLREIYLPIFKADLLMSETYIHEYNPDTSRMQCDITILSGMEDRIVYEEDLQHWTEYTKSKCTYHMLKGGHFFIHDNQLEIANIINHSL
ncbi:thioesterase II family protein [Anaeromicropila populeti]|uniref:Surfactin synthase thioesterase subunit n=1 Tax=Anaeromicropila populeti TaxID=37658 RepID=A0A1I6HNS3_9FIRM|nr:thioesterase domain-containing protein [Anaeromicropila populeti]SFR56103.1 Surfactin synthase thioesterase subunit [Anaeromicropila populeti]